MSENLGDNIDNLPMDGSTVPSPNDIKMVDTLFKPKISMMQRLFSGTKEFVILFLLYIAISLPQVDTLIRQFVNTESPYIILGIKGFILVVTYFVIANMYLVRKAN